MATTEKGQLVPVTVTITDAQGTTTTEEKSISEGPTEVPTLKAELGVPEADSLFVIKDGKRKLLADHEHHNVKAGDEYVAVGKGGVS